MSTWSAANRRIPASSVAPIARCYRGSLRPWTAWFSPARRGCAHGRDHQGAAPRLPAAGDRRRGDRSRRRDAPLRLADDRAEGGRARTTGRRGARGGARARRGIGDRGHASRARRAGRGAGRRGDHVADHLAGDGERDRPHRSDAGLRRRSRRRPERRSRPRRGARDRADESDPPRPPRRAALRPRAAVATRTAGRRGRRTRVRERVPGTQGGGPVGCFVLLAVRDEERRRGRRRADRDEPRRSRSRGPGAPPDAARRRLALRHRRAGVQGEPLRRSRGDRARAARQDRAAS